MTAVNPLHPSASALHPSASALRDSRPYEPSMEEILASIRRIIADDQSLPGRSGAFEEPRAETSHSIEAPMADPVSAPVHVLHPSAEARDEAVADDTRSAPPVGFSEKTEARSREAELSTKAQSFVAHGPIAAPQYASPEGPIVAGEEIDLPSVMSASAETAPRPSTPRHAPMIEEVVSQDVSVTEANARVPAPVSEPPAAWHDQSEPVEKTSVAGLDRPNALFSAATDESVAAAFQALAATRLADNTDDLLAMTRDMIRPLLKTWLDDNLPSMVERLVRAEIERVARGTR